MHWEGTHRHYVIHPSTSERLFLCCFLVLVYSFLCHCLLKLQYVRKHFSLSDALDFSAFSCLFMAHSQVLAWKWWSPREIRPVLLRLRACLEKVEKRERIERRGQSLHPCRSSLNSVMFSQRDNFIYLLFPVGVL